MQGENDNADIGAGGPFLPSTVSVFLPAGVIILGYSAAYAALFIAGRGEGNLARLCLVVVAIGGPFLVAHALLRRFTARVDIMSHAVFAHPGFPRNEPYEIPYSLIRRLTLSRGPVGRLTGTGTLTFELVTGSPISVSDIARPSQAIAVVGRRIEDASTRVAAERGPLKAADPAAISAG